jgi:hypothetical protein
VSVHDRMQPVPRNPGTGVINDPFTRGGVLEQRLRPGRSAYCSVCDKPLDRLADPPDRAHLCAAHAEFETIQTDNEFGRRFLFSIQRLVEVEDRPVEPPIVEAMLASAEDSPGELLDEASPV